MSQRSWLTAVQSLQQAEWKMEALVPAMKKS